MLLTTRQLAERWGMSEGTLRNWRVLGRGPKYLRIGNQVRYKLSVIKAYEERK
jgi:predicted DNA-binding transcriptional regulator AlpA